MMIKARHQLGRIIRVAVQHPCLGDDAALGLRHPQHPAELGRFPRLAFADNRRVGFKQTNHLLARRYRLPLQHPSCGLRDDLLDPRHERLQRVEQSLSRTVALLLELCLELLLDLLRLFDHLLRDVHQLLIALPYLVGGCFAPVAGGVDQLLGDPPDGAHPVPAQRPRASNRALQDRFGALDGAGEHARAIGQQGAVDGIMDGRRDDGAIEAQLAATGDPILPRQVDNMIEQVLQGGGLDQVGPAQQGGGIGHARHTHDRTDAGPGYH